MVVKIDVHLPKYPKLADKNVPSLHIVKALLSLKDYGYVRYQFS